jgi:hypothetical protein
MERAGCEHFTNTQKVLLLALSSNSVDSGQGSHFNRFISVVPSGV